MVAWKNAPDASTPLSAATLAAAFAERLPLWAPTTVYALGAQVVSPGNDVVSAVAAHTSGATYTAANWTLSSTYAPIGDSASPSWYTGALAATYDRCSTPAGTGAAFSASGWLYCTAVVVKKSITTNNAVWFNGATAAVTPTHQWAVLLDSTGKVIAVTADGTITAIGANAAFTWAWTAATALIAGLYYVGVCVVAGTIMSPVGANLGANGPGGTTIPPRMNAIPLTGQTTPVALGAQLTITGNGGWQQLVYLT